MKLTKVTSWSAETPDGKIYAERETDTGQWWSVTFHKKRLCVRVRGFKAAVALAAQWVSEQEMQLAERKKRKDNV